MADDPILHDFTSGEPVWVYYYTRKRGALRFRLLREFMTVTGLTDYEVLLPEEGWLQRCKRNVFSATAEGALERALRIEEQYLIIQQKHLDDAIEGCRQIEEHIRELRVALGLSPSLRAPARRRARIDMP